MPMQLVVFTLELQRYALPLARVQRVVRMMEVTPLPEAPGIVLGVIDLEGKIIPVMSMRKRFGLSEPEASLDDQLIVADMDIACARRLSLRLLSRMCRLSW
jgi:purine-binding chemotaxis protein CheW